MDHIHEEGTTPKMPGVIGEFKALTVMKGSGTIITAIRVVLPTQLHMDIAVKRIGIRGIEQGAFQGINSPRKDCSRPQ